MSAKGQRRAAKVARRASRRAKGKSKGGHGKVYGRRTDRGWMPDPFDGALLGISALAVLADNRRARR